MSMLLMVKAMQTKVGNPLRKLVLIKLADNANDEGECWPSYQYIADQCEISKRSVINHVKALEQSGIVRTIKRDGPKGNTSNLFKISLPSAALSLPPVNLLHHPSESPALPPSESPAPRTSHSLEPVIEPILGAKAPAAQKKIFKPPLIIDVIEYMGDRSVSHSDLRKEAEKFCDFYESKGWMVGKNKMKDWKAAVRNWLKNYKPTDSGEGSTEWINHMEGML